MYLDLTDRGLKLALVSKEKEVEQGNNTMITEEKNENVAELNINRQRSSEQFPG